MRFRQDMPIKEFAEFAVAENFYVVNVITKEIRVFEREAVRFCCKFVKLLHKFVIEMTNVHTGRHYDSVYTKADVVVFSTRDEAIAYANIGRTEK